MPIVERLHAEGYPVVKINISERPDLAQRFGVQVIPTFVLVIGGREQQRISGMQDESVLRNMLAQIPQRAPRNHATKSVADYSWSMCCSRSTRPKPRRSSRTWVP